MTYKKKQKKKGHRRTIYIKKWIRLGDIMPEQMFPSTMVIATELIQQYLDENNRLIYAIVHDQDLGNLQDSARKLDRLQQNLSYLTALADKQQSQFTIAANQQAHNIVAQPAASQHMQAQLYSTNAAVPRQTFELIQPQPSQQCLSGAVMQQNPQAIQTQQAQQMNPRTLMFAQPQSSQSADELQEQMLQAQLSQPPNSRLAQVVMLYNAMSQAQLCQQVMLHDQVYRQSQLQQAALHAQGDMSSGTASGISMLHNQAMGNYGILLNTGAGYSVGSSRGTGSMVAGSVMPADQVACFSDRDEAMALYRPDSEQEGYWGVGSG